MGDLSAHFSLWEFEDRRAGVVRRPSRELLAILECIRDAIGRPLRIVSGYRTPATNRAVGGARRSYHLSARAADLPLGDVPLELAIRCGARGIGVRDGWVVHVDDRRSVRPVIFRD